MRRLSGLILAASAAVLAIVASGCILSSNDDEAPSYRFYLGASFTDGPGVAFYVATDSVYSLPAELTGTVVMAGNAIDVTVGEPRELPDGDVSETCVGPALLRADFVLTEGSYRLTVGARDEMNEYRIDIAGATAKIRRIRGASDVIAHGAGEFDLREPYYPKGMRCMPI